MSRRIKKNDVELFDLIEKAVRDGNYLFTKHANLRAIERWINKTSVLKILVGEKDFSRKRNKSKDVYNEGEQEWRYCIEGKDGEGKLRIIVTFEEELMPIITVIAL